MAKYREHFNQNINQITGQLDHKSDNCGYILKCYANGYKMYCDQPAEAHQEEQSGGHAYQKGGISYQIDQKYQRDLYAIYFYYGELILMSLVELIREGGAGAG